MRLTIIMLWLALLATSATASDFCFDEAGEMYGISPAVLRAIARVESSMQPDAVNWNSNGTYDYGVMQINSWWSSRLGLELWGRLGDPCTNVMVGAWILAQCLDRHGETMEGLGCYNSGKPSRQRWYARKVLTALPAANSKN